MYEKKKPPFLRLSMQSKGSFRMIVTNQLYHTKNRNAIHPTSDFSRRLKHLPLIGFGIRTFLSAR